MRFAVKAALVTLVCLTSIMSGAPARAAELDPQLAAAMLRPNDLSATYGKTSDVWNNDLGRGVVPMSCTMGPSGSWAEGRVADTTYFKEIDYSRNQMIWQDTIFMYPTAAQARTSFMDLQRASLTNCSSTFDTTVGDAGENIPVTQVNVTTVLSKAMGMPRFAVETDTILKNQQQATDVYHDNAGYGVFLLDGSVIHQVQVYQDTPILRIERKNAAKAAAVVAARFSALP
jgi:hypothetical protein